MRYRDPAELDKIGRFDPAFDPDVDFLVITGIDPFRPRDGAEDPCPTCGTARDQRVRRSPRRAGRVVCANCCRSSLDDTGYRFGGLAVGSAMDESYPVDTPTVYAPDEELAGGKGAKRGKVKGKRVKAKGKRGKVKGKTGAKMRGNNVGD